MSSKRPNRTAELLEAFLECKSALKMAQLAGIDHDPDKYEQIGAATVRAHRIGSCATVPLDIGPHSPLLELI